MFIIQKPYNLLFYISISKISSCGESEKECGDFSLYSHIIIFFGVEIKL